MRNEIIGFCMSVAAAAMAVSGAAAAPGFSFAAIDGGEISLEELRDGPVLVVNTASRCGYTGQYAGLQELYDTYRERGLTVLAVPSNSFNQELGSNEEVKAFCEINYSLNLPMTEVTDVKGEGAHPFFLWLKEAHGFEPQWNFNKALLNREGEFVTGWGAATEPMSEGVLAEVESALAP